MAKVFTFKVEIEGLEEKIWRKIEITDKRMISELAYAILASFDSLAYHLYQIYHGEDRYHCMIGDVDFFHEVQVINATQTKLNQIDFSSNNKMVMEYDFGSTTNFIITLVDTRDLERYKANHYPYVIDGAGRGMLDDISQDDLKDIVDDIDKKGYSDYDFTPGYERSIKYDYRDYNMKLDNALLKGEIVLIRDKYEPGYYVLETY